MTRQILGWVWPKQPNLFQRGEFPVWNIDAMSDAHPPEIYYGFPLADNASEGIGLKLARHFPGENRGPDEITQQVTSEDEEEIRKPLRRYIPEANGDLLALKVCRYTNSPDGNFLIDRHPDAANVHIACGFSGHGFKFSSVIGKTLAELSTEGKTSRPIGFLGFNDRPLWR